MLIIGSEYVHGRKMINFFIYILDEDYENSFGYFTAQAGAFIKLNYSVWYANKQEESI